MGLSQSKRCLSAARRVPGHLISVPTTGRVGHPSSARAGIPGLWNVIVHKKTSIWVVLPTRFLPEDVVDFLNAHHGQHQTLRPCISISSCKTYLAIPDPLYFELTLFLPRTSDGKNKNGQKCARPDLTFEFSAKLSDHALCPNSFAE